MNALERIFERLKSEASDPEPEPEYTCAACKDTGWVEVDDGLEDGKRVRSPKDARCTSLAHIKPVSPAPSTAERFS